MKRKFLTIIKKYGYSLLEYRTYRSDMGCQVYDISVQMPGGKILLFSDSYFFGGNPNDKQKVVNQFESELIEFKS